MNQRGISGIGIAVPRNILRLEDLARARGIPPGKFINGLGQESFAVPCTNQDSVTLAADALDDLIRRTGIDPGDIGRLVVGTETEVDHAKSISSYLMDLFPLPRTCETFEVKQACIGGTYALNDAMDWSSLRGKIAVVINSDISRYEIGGAGEPTQGAGAVALLVTPQPSLLTFDLPTGTSIGNENTFYRPLGSEHAIVDGKESVKHYLAGLVRCYDDFLKNDGNPEHDLFVSHLPYTAIAKKAFAVFTLVQKIREASPDATEDGFAELVERIFAGELKEIIEEAKATPDFEDRFQTQTAPSLPFSRRVGNIYTGSMYLGLSSVLTELGEPANGQSKLFYSFGSGSSAKMMRATVQDNRVDVRLPTPIPLTVQDYEHVRRGGIILEDRGVVIKSIDGLTGIRQYKRT